MSALDELLEMEKERKERIKRIDSLIYRVIHEESKRLSEKLIDKMRNGELGFAEKLAHDAGYASSYAAMCSLSKERKDRLYYRILDLMENELWSYHLPREFRNLLRELHLENDTDKDAVAKDLQAIEERIKNGAQEQAIQELEGSVFYAVEEDDDEGIEDDEESEEDEEDEEVTTLEDNWYFNALCEKMRNALLSYCKARKSKRLNNYVEYFLNNLSMFRQGEDIDDNFSFFIMIRFSANGNQDHEALNVSLHSDEFIISKGGYVHGPYGGDSYTDWRMFFWPSGGMDLPIDERYELDRYTEMIDSIEYIANSKKAQFYIEMPDEYYANPVGDNYDNEEGSDEEED